MIFHQIYECETCGKTSKLKDSIKHCEASHLGLNLAEHCEYQHLQLGVRDFTNLVNKENSEHARKSLNFFITALAEFKEKYNID